MAPPSAHPSADERGALPLSGRTVVVTRPAGQAAALAEPLRALGATVILAPLIEIVSLPPDDALRAAVAALADYELAVFTSANAVDVFCSRVAELGGDLGLLGGTPVAAQPDSGTVVIAAIGEKTAAALREHGIVPAIVPETFVAESLIEAVKASGIRLAGARVLIPRAREGREVLPGALRSAGAAVDVLAVYETRAVTQLPLSAEQLLAADFITFASGSAVESFVALLGAARLAERLAGTGLCAIGPVTSRALREHGLPVAVEAEEATGEALAAAVAALAAA